MNNTKLNIIGAIAVIALLIGGWATLTKTSPPSPSQGFGSTAANTVLSNGVVLKNFTTVDAFLVRQAQEIDGMLGFQGLTVTTGLLEQTAVGTCSTASSTLFAVNPFFGQATSTVTFANIQGTQGATTTDILVGTSTTPSAGPTVAVATSSVNRSLFGMMGVATSSNFDSYAGITAGDNGYTVPSSGTYQASAVSIIVAPTEYVLGFSTSTNGGIRNGGTGATQVGVPSSCTYKLTFKI